MCHSGIIVLMDIKESHIYHYSVNVIATIISFVLYYANPALLIPMLGIGISLGNGYRRSKSIGGWDWEDITFDCYGIVTVFALTLIMMYIGGARG